MARGSSPAPRRGGLAPAALAVLLAVLTALFLPPSHGGAEHRPSSRVASAAGGHVTSAFEIIRADSGAQADDGHGAALLRSPRDVSGDRLPSRTRPPSPHRARRPARPGAGPRPPRPPCPRRSRPLRRAVTRGAHRLLRQAPELPFSIPSTVAVSGRGVPAGGPS
ncbi:hypothetical protein [Streptomyces scabiei]|uniref:hypothetical protein n=1 Tax=Streptomyces scabiei TaxID=1930 RepID=UPI001B322B3E|nr:hypothetical protein [Streptomyces sp. LBUM 1488]MBP5904176.1 hypothetical protein [Streptomyces sp. LBUM 1488]